jgi:TfoX/Sxy family transcriptional regulator of competence genes
MQELFEKLPYRSLFGKAVLYDRVQSLRRLWNIDHRFSLINDISYKRLFGKGIFIIIFSIMIIRFMTTHLL